jgi:hypothetical protein
MEEVPNNEEEPQTQIMDHMIHLYSGMGSFLPQIAQIQGEFRQTQIWSIFYYAAEASYCVLNTWFTPNRFFRTGNVFLEKTHHLALIPVILNSRSQIEKLFLKHFRVKNEDTLLDFDRVLSEFFEATGYKPVRNLSAKTLGKEETSIEEAHCRKEVLDGKAYARRLEAAVTSEPEFSAVIRQLGANSAQAVLFHVGALVGAHCYFMNEVTTSHLKFDSMQIFNAMSDETKRILANSMLRKVSALEAFPDTNMRQAIVGAFLGPAHANSSDQIIGPDLLFSMKLTAYFQYASNVFTLAIQEKAKASEKLTAHVQPLALSTFVVMLSVGGFASTSVDIFSRISAVSVASIRTVTEILSEPPFGG